MSFRANFFFFLLFLIIWFHSPLVKVLCFEKDSIIGHPETECPRVPLVQEFVLISVRSEIHVFNVLRDIQIYAP